MIHKTLITVLFTMLLNTLFAQKIKEPEFIGECILVKNDGSTLPLEKSFITTRTAANTSLFITGFGAVNENIQIDGCCSGVIFSNSNEVQIIIKTADNNFDPLSTIRIFKLKNSKKKRYATLSTINNFGTKNTNKLNYLPFRAEKYGTSSYILKFTEIPSGEYGIIVSNPNSLMENQIIISTFAAI